MKTDLICELCGANLGRHHWNTLQFKLLDHYRVNHRSEVNHLEALYKDFREWKEQYGLKMVLDILFV
ncbi:hypothetical protein LCGC14_2931660 [marine sediment metagenome]|uniref:Uncharacterized protein n=1 Tax=marine sediment metagenome TaxID=412755 RepID=A0A0F8Y7P7_9ZZZZ